MKPRKIKENIYWLGAIDWDRRLFDALIPLLEDTSYNAYLVQGSEKTALLDAVDPSMVEVLFAQLASVPTIDYVIAHHAEQDHSSAIPQILEKYKDAKVICTPKCKEFLINLLRVPEYRIIPAWVKFGGRATQNRFLTAGTKVAA